jgi:hypothetical protein
MMLSETCLFDLQLSWNIRQPDADMASMVMRGEAGRGCQVDVPSRSTCGCVSG